MNLLLFKSVLPNVGGRQGDLLSDSLSEESVALAIRNAVGIKPSAGSTWEDCFRFRAAPSPGQPGPVTDGGGIKRTGPFPPRWANSAWLHELQRLLSGLHGTTTTTNPASLPFPSTDIDSKNTS